MGNFTGLFVFILALWYFVLRCSEITAWLEQKLPAATVNPRRDEGHPDTLRSSCRSSSTKQRLEEKKGKERKTALWRFIYTGGLKYSRGLQPL